MQTEAIFENIAEHLQSEISKANKSIFLAIMGLTNINLFNELLIKAKSGCEISIILSSDILNQNSQIDFDQFASNNFHIYRVGNGDKELMNTQFCVVDHSTVITGSYNWGNQSESNFENIIITHNDTALAEQFISKFNEFRRKNYPDEPKTEIVFPLDKIIKRLEILKNYIVLEDLDEFKRETIKLKAYEFNNDINEIITDIVQEKFAAAINKIQHFISKNQQLLLYTDPEIAALKLEIRNLENQVNAYDNERIELEKMLSEFQHRHSIELGEIILEILKLRKLKFKADKTKYDEAENDERKYREQIDAERKREVFELSDEEKKELKKKFRKATVLCHPDKVSDEFKEAAQKIFIELKDAYDINDLKKVTEILNDLERGNYFRTKSETVSEKDLLRVAIAELRKQIKVIENEIISIKQSETFKTIISIDDWDDYFSKTKEKLQKELEEIKLEVDA